MSLEALSDALKHLTLDLPESIPTELWLNIIQFFDRPTLASFSRTSKHFRVLCHPALFQHLVIKVRRTKHARGLIRLQHKLACYESSSIAPLVQAISIFGSANNRTNEVDVVFGSLASFPQLRTLLIRYTLEKLSLSLISCVLDPGVLNITDILDLNMLTLRTDYSVESLSAHTWTHLLSPTTLCRLDIALPQTTQSFINELVVAHAVFPQVEFLRLDCDGLLASPSSSLVGMTRLCEAFPALRAFSIIPPLPDMFAPQPRRANWSSHLTLAANALPLLSSFHGPSDLFATSVYTQRPIFQLKLFTNTAEFPDLTPIAGRLTTLEMNIALPFNELIETLDRHSFAALRAFRLSIAHYQESPRPGLFVEPAAIIEALNRTTLPLALEIFFVEMKISVRPRARVVALLPVPSAVRRLGQRHDSLRHIVLISSLHSFSDRDMQENFRVHRWKRASVGQVEIQDISHSRHWDSHSSRIGWKRRTEVPSPTEETQEQLNAEWFGLTKGFGGVDF
ncbi:hypothetical protein MIND_01308800 [Mycena indigotica]|uniref:F-box domain-containing protein n=1 Tax=Mycena indigotica TaxID=2126181 RepID=A0A8H6S1V0_9AGAR|nr:uncharacterized protein MIND_01308800 [Mycena indigotica]KAF7290685.1 hypothetical protein MIND_01308800 [Mycena indigotica]